MSNYNGISKVFLEREVGCRSEVLIQYEGVSIRTVCDKYLKCEVNLLVGSYDLDLINLKKVENNLKQLTDLTEKKYSLVYETLPPTESEIQFISQEIQIVLNKLLFNAGSNSIVTETLNNLLVESEFIVKSLVDQQLIDSIKKAFVNEADQEQLSFSSLINLVNEVEEALAELRDLALNSIIFSIRIGDEGAAFRVLTDRINEVSISVAKEFCSIRDNIKNLNDWHADFQNLLSAFAECMEDLFSECQDGLQTETQGINATLDTICRILKDHLDNTQRPLSDISNIMVMVQNQDIIRQNIENLIKCINIIFLKRETALFESEEAELDYIVFTLRVVELIEKMIENIDQDLNRSVIEINELLYNMTQKISELEEDSVYLSRLLIGEGNSQNTAILDTTFDDTCSNLEDTVRRMSTINSEGDLLKDKKETFLDLLNQIDKRFKEILVEAGNLKKMKVLIKIELARLDIHGDSALDNMAPAIEWVIEIMSKNLAVFDRLYKFFSSNIGKFDGAISLSKQKVLSSIGKMEQIGEKLELVRDLSSAAVASSLDQMKLAAAELKKPADSLAETDAARSLILDSKSLISDLKTSLNEVKQTLFDKYQVNSWQEKEDDLKILEQQFTCFIERKTMNEMTENVILDIGDEGGDITLF